MPLEFALRPRFDLERPARPRRLAWLRLSPLVLPIAAYWLVLAGGTHALIRAASGEPMVLFEGGALPSAEALAMGGSDVSAPAPAQLPEPAPLAPSTSEPAIVPPPSEPAEPAHVIAPADAVLGVAPPPEPVVRRDPARSERREPLAFQRSRPLVDVDVPLPVRREVFDPFAEAAPLERDVDAPSHSTATAARPGSSLREDAPRDEETPQAGRLPSCESVAASANDTIDLRGARRAPDLTRGVFASVLEHGAYFSHCGVPARTAIEICAAVQDGRVVGVSVTTEPRNQNIASCVRRAVAGLRFPRNERLDVTRTRFDPGP